MAPEVLDSSWNTALHVPGCGMTEGASELSRADKTREIPKGRREQQSAEEASKAESAKGGAFSQNLQNVIENSDRDGQVYADAEGAGSQGSPFETEEEEERPPEDELEDEEESGGLDLEA